MHLALPYGWAILVRCVTLALVALGVVLQRKSHLINDKRPLQLQKTALKRPLWHLGFWLYAISSLIGDLVGISSLPILVIAPLTTLVLFFNAIYSQALLKESMHSSGWIGTTIIAMASVVLAIVMNLPNIPRNAKEMRQLLRRPGYIVFCVVNIILLFVCFLLIHVFKRKKIHVVGQFSARVQDDVEDGVEDGVENGNRGIISPNATVTPAIQRLDMYVALLYQFTSTLVAAQALVFAKITFDLLQTSLLVTQQNISSLTVTVLIITVVTTVLQLVLFNLSLHYYSTLVTVPFGYSIGIVLACINTLIYYNSFSLLSPWKSVLVIVSVLSTVFGIYLLSR